MKIVYQPSIFLLLVSLLFVQCKKDVDEFVPEPEKETEKEEDYSDKNAAEYVENTATMNLFYQAMVKADMMESLRDENQQLTIFVPTAEAFQNLLDENDAYETIDDISSSTLSLLMKYHISTTGKIMKAQFKDNLPIKILYQDRSVYIRMPDADTQQVTTGGFSIANIESTDALTKNAVIHLIDKVLVP